MRIMFLTPVMGLSLIVASIALHPSDAAEPSAGTASPDGWIELFDGESLAGWRVSENPDSVKVEDGTIVVHGPRAHLFYVGDVAGADFKNFEFRCDVMTQRGANSGIYFHTHFQETDWPNTGYEAQVNNSQRDPQKTGSLYAVEPVLEAPAEDNQWFDYHITVRGKRIVLRVNDETVVDYTEPDDLVRPTRQLSSGTFALQAHDPGSRVAYRNIRVKLLDDE